MYAPLVKLATLMHVAIRPLNIQTHYYMHIHSQSHDCIKAQAVNQPGVLG